MLTTLAVVGLLLAVWLTVFPIFDATKHDRSPWPWIIGGLVAGPLSGVLYLASRSSVRAADRRNAPPE